MTDSAGEAIDWRDVDLEMVRQIHRQGEEYLKAQLQCAIAADQRAVTLASILAATSLAVFAATAANWQAASDRALAAGCTAAVVLLLGAALGVWAAKPVAFMFPGNDPQHWFSSRHTSLENAIGGEAENLSQHIRANNKILEENQQALMGGMLAAVFAPIIGAVVWIIVG